MEAQLSLVAALNKTGIDIALGTVLLQAEAAEKRVMAPSPNVYDIASGVGVQLLDLTECASSAMRKEFFCPRWTGDGRFKHDGLTQAAKQPASWRIRR